MPKQRLNAMPPPEKKPLRRQSESLEEWEAERVLDALATDDSQTFDGIERTCMRMRQRGCNEVVLSRDEFVKLQRSPHFLTRLQAGTLRPSVNPQCVGYIFGMEVTLA